jgi:hypothetical protein
MFRISLREIFVLVAAIALSIVSLKYASSMWQAIVGMLYLIGSFAAVIIAIFDHAARRAFAIGFIVAALGYGALVVNGHKAVNGTLVIPVDLVASNWDYALPTTLFLRDIYRRTCRTIWIDETTGRGSSAEQADRYQAAVAAGNISGLPNMSSRTLPSGNDFVITGHCWVGLLFGYLGGKFAQFVYLRRRREQAAGTAIQAA